MNRPSLDELMDEFSEVVTDGKPQISAGDSYNIDDYVELIQHLGYDISCENIVDDYGFIARVTINGKNHAIWQGGITSTEHSVLMVHQPLSTFEKQGD